ncbi:dicarboxylate/amino acid:cation symporter [Pseudoleptotrichia goodfellowii]|uniref:Transporter, dicarboxylate/amino acid:cation Na+/H+ symporter family protein n=1 Tax=Pseudoleptotrichia goodfellowii F0264 TaxID=596323 RepID=D0GLZ9_9FUSO|nr:dicarboxylate/amino acid:cation symporter [Pseudoleptotrichia goodfellowii]EEY34953.1 transporter, dicarboxylate/amino acid:cation Na+/H+ symporter family protein [Pseudoleptotrichia goodfellowii F0264]
MSEKKKLLNLSLTSQILIATFGGIIFGGVVGPWASNLKVFGDIFLRLIQMSVIMLVMSAVIVAVGRGSTGDAGKMGFHTFKWIIFFTLTSAFMGVVLSYYIQPGIGVAHMTEVGKNAVTANALQDTSLKDTILAFFTTNIFSSMASSAMVPCIIFSLFFGIAMSQHIRDTGKTIVLDWILSVNEIIVNIIKNVMKVSPIGIFCLLADVTGSKGFTVIIPMIKFLIILIIGDILQLVIYGLITAFICKVNPLKMPKKFAKMSIIALTTTSSAISLPTKMEDTVIKFGVSRKVSDFTGPITMSMNSSGWALCNVTAIFFIAQFSGVQLTPYQMVMAVILSCLMCMGSVVVPGGAIIVFTFLATSMGLPLDSIVVLIGIDWFSGMFRTLNNVDIDVLVAMLVANRIDEFDRDVYNNKKVVEY